MSFLKRAKAEFLRILRFDLKSHWELLYHDIGFSEDLIFCRGLLFPNKCVIVRPTNLGFSGQE